MEKSIEGDACLLLLSQNQGTAESTLTWDGWLVAISYSDPKKGHGGANNESGARLQRTKRRKGGGGQSV